MIMIHWRLCGYIRDPWWATCVAAPHTCNVHIIVRIGTTAVVTVGVTTDTGVVD